MEKKLKLLILFGGVSNEHEVSLMSTASILQKINIAKYDITRVGITKKGTWLLTNATAEEIKSGEWEKRSDNMPVTINLTGSCKGLRTIDGTDIPIECVFAVMHGKNAEDGSLQGLFQIADIPIVGPHLRASAVGMDKVMAKLIAATTGVAQAEYYAINRYKFATNPLGELANITKALNGEYPFFVKPSNSGSSVGISKATNEKELFEAIKLAANIDDRILIEKTITGREIEVAVLGNSEARASRIGEILSANDQLYDYESKYVNAASRTVIVDDLPKDVEAKIRQMAVDIYHAFDCRGLSRVDFFYTDKGELVFNEINTLPGFTSISMYPQLWQDMGLTYSEIVDKLIEYAMEEN